MSGKTGKILLLSGLIGLGLTSGVIAASMKELQGAWTMNGTDCADTFKKVGKKIEFKDRGASTTTGLLIVGSKVSGPMAICTTQSVRKQKDRLSARLSCTDSMIQSDVTAKSSAPKNFSASTRLATTCMSPITSAACKELKSRHFRIPPYLLSLCFSGERFVIGRHTQSEPGGTMLAPPGSDCVLPRDS